MLSAMSIEKKIVTNLKKTLIDFSSTPSALILIYIRFLLMILQLK